MTTGSYDKNYSTVGPSGCGPSTTFADRRTKTWNGADRPKTYSKPTLVMFPGSENLVRRIWVKAPKRAYISADNPYTCSWSTIKDPRMGFLSGVPPVWKDGSVSSCFGGGSYTPENPLTANDRNKTIAKLQDKIMGSDFDLSVFLGESNQALAMLADRATRLRKAFNAVKKGNFALARHHFLVSSQKRSPSLAAYNARRREMRLTGNTSANALAPVQRFSDVASNWLEMSYGWLPLVDDIYDAAQTIAHFHNVAHTKTYRTSVTVQGAKPVPQYASYKWGKSGNTAKYSIKAVIREINHASLLGLTDPAKVMWELLPWSFVIDWALPIGTYLDARKVASSVTGTFTISEKWVYYYGNPIGIGFTIVAPSYYREIGQFSRTVTSTLTATRPSVKGFGESLTWMRAANALALLVQAGK